MTISSRPAQMEDLPGIVSLIAQARAAIAQLGIDQWQDGYPQPELIEEDITLDRARVFEVNGELAGYMVPLTESEPIYDSIQGRWLSDAPYLTIHRMAIGDGFRGTGLSMRMLSFAEDWARAHNLSSVRLDTHRGNLAMRRLAQKCGYTFCGEVVYETCGDPIRVAYEKIID